jgi:DNA-binding CsgD family transcriptional regulator
VTTIDTTREAIEDRIHRVKVLTEQGNSIPDIARILRVTPRSVQRYRKQAGVAQPPSPRWSREQRELALSMLKDGCSCEEVGRTLGMSSGRLRKAFPDYRFNASQIADMGVLSRMFRGLP